MNDERIVWGKSINGLRLGIILNNDIYKIIDDPVLLEIFIANDTNQKAQVIETIVFHDYEFILRKKNNEKVQLTPEGNKTLLAFKNNNDASRAVFVLAPKTIRNVLQNVKLDYLFDLKEQGIYTVVAVMKNRMPDHDVLYSGVFKFEMMQ